MSIEIKRSDKYVDYNISATNNRGYITIDTSDWINKPWMFYELPALKFEIYTETDGELVKYQNFTREIRTYNPVYSPLGVLNVTIDIRNVPEEFILRITPIFDNDAVAARNMLIENGIEDGDVWGSDQDVPTQLFNLNLEFIECDGEYIPPTPPVPPTHEETITGVPPIAFDGSTGEPLVSWTILGNGQQTGTPTPDNPILPEFVGKRTGNLVDPSTLTPGYLNTSGSVSAQSGTMLEFTSDFIPISGSGYTWSLSEDWGDRAGWLARVFYDADKEMIGSRLGGIVTEKSGAFSVPSGAAYVRISWRSYGTIAVFLSTGSTALPYEPYGWKVPITCAGQTVPVYLGQVSTVRRVKKLVLTGEETGWSENTSGTNTFRGALTLPYENMTGAGGFCSHNIYKISGISADEEACSCYRGALYFRISKTIASNVTSFKQWLSQQYAAGTPVTIWYALETPETAIVNEPLAKIGDYADELSSEDAGVTIPTVKGNNVLTVESELQPSEVTITYMKEGQ